MAVITTGTLVLPAERIRTGGPSAVIDFGRTADEAHFGLSNGGTFFSSGEAAGDVGLCLDDTARKVLIGVGSGSLPEVSIANGAVTVTGAFGVTGVAAFGTTVVTGASAGDVVLPNNSALRAVNAASTGTIAAIKVNASDELVLNANSKTVAFVIANHGSVVYSTATGGAQTLPANPAGFIGVRLAEGGSLVKVPYYNS